MEGEGQEEKEGGKWEGKEEKGKGIKVVVPLIFQNVVAHLVELHRLTGVGFLLLCHTFKRVAITLL